MQSHHQSTHNFFTHQSSLPTLLPDSTGLQHLLKHHVFINLFTRTAVSEKLFSLRQAKEGDDNKDR